MARGVEEYPEGRARLVVGLGGSELEHGSLAVVEVRLMLTYIRAGADELPSTAHDDGTDDPDRPLAFAY